MLRGRHDDTRLDQARYKSVTRVSMQRWSDSSGLFRDSPVRVQLPVS